jgi:hypothetical protein
MEKIMTKGKAWSDHTKEFEHWPQMFQRACGHHVSRVQSSARAQRRPVHWLQHCKIKKVTIATSALGGEKLTKQKP